ncbi:hypothetical protein ACJX0J_006981, partial [Zea mays]
DAEAENDTNAVPGDIRAVTCGGELNSEHVLLELEVHVPDLRHLHAQHRGLDHVRRRRRPQVGDRRREDPAGARQDRGDRGVAGRGDHHQPVQRSGREEAVEGARRPRTRHRRRRSRGATRELGQRVAARAGELHLLVDLLHLAGFVHKEVPGQAVSDGVDVPGRRPAVGGLRGVRAAGRAGLARRLRPQLLGHRVRGDRLQWLDRRHPAVVQQGERPRVRRHVQPPPHRHGGTPRLLRLRRKPIRWE